MTEFPQTRKIGRNSLADRELKRRFTTAEDATYIGRSAKWLRRSFAKSPIQPVLAYSASGRRQAQVKVRK